MPLTKSGAYPIKIVSNALLRRISPGDILACSGGVTELSAFSSNPGKQAFTVETHATNAYFHRSQFSRFPSKIGAFEMFLDSTICVSSRLPPGPLYSAVFNSALALFSSLRVAVSAAPCCSYACSVQGCMLLGQLFNLCLQIASDFLHRFHQRTNRKTGTTNTGDGLQPCTLTKHFLPQNAGETIRISNRPVCARKCQHSRGVTRRGGSFTSHAAHFVGRLEVSCWYHAGVATSEL